MLKHFLRHFFIIHKIYFRLKEMTKLIKETIIEPFIKPKLISILMTFNDINSSASLMALLSS